MNATQRSLTPDPYNFWGMSFLTSHPMNHNASTCFQCSRARDGFSGRRGFGAAARQEQRQLRPLKPFEANLIGSPRPLFLCGGGGGRAYPRKRVHVSRLEVVLWSRHIPTLGGEGVDPWHLCGNPCASQEIPRQSKPCSLREGPHDPPRTRGCIAAKQVKSAKMSKDPHKCKVQRHTLPCVLCRTEACLSVQ